MEIKCTVIDVIFQNKENGYTVLNMDADGRSLTAVGIFPDVKEGEMMTLWGEMKMNKKFGEQFTVDRAEIARPTSNYAVEKYLASGLFHGIGAVTAGRIVRMFGEKTLDVIGNSPELLAKVNGVSKKKAQEIGQQYKENNSMRDAMMFLQANDISNSFAMKIYKAYGDDAVAIVKNNPYRLVSDIDGIGFLKADKIAEKLGITGNNEFRVQAGIVHILNEAEGRDGHTFLPEEELFDKSAALLAISDQEILISALQHLILNNTVKIHTVRENFIARRRVALAKNYLMENAIAAKLVQMRTRERARNFDSKKTIEIFEQQNKLTLHENQKEAIRLALDEGAVVISGGPGTGKTTIIKCIVDTISEAGKKVALAAPTGRAAKRMSEATGYTAKTIHRLLMMDMGNGKSDFKYNEFNPLEADVVIVDEISMADIYIFSSLLNALRPDAALILVGDKDQLPSVSAGNILSDILESGILPSVNLSYIYRQAEGSLIIDNAHRINRGEMPVIDNRSTDFFFDEKENAEAMVAAAVSMVKERLPKFLSVSPDDIQVLAPVKKSVAGVENLNKKLQQALNPDGREVQFRDTAFRVGDKVMHIKNNYNLEWERRTAIEGGGELSEKGVGVFNGDMGHIIAIDDDFVIVLFEDDRIVRYDRADLEELMLAYAISIHKSQGSEFPVAIIVIGSGAYLLLTRNLLYTAVTRAKRMVVIIGGQKTVYRMVKNNNTQQRNTLLKELIQENLKKRASFL